jgi:hypothetical protein
MEITEFDVSLGQLVTRTLSAEEEAELTAINNRGLLSISYSLEDSREDQVSSVISQYVSKGYSQEEAEFLAASLVR